MFSLTIAFGNGQTMWQFLFREKEKAEQSYDEVDNSLMNNFPVRLTDDFGQKGYFAAKDIMSFMLEDMTLSKQAHIERALHHARTQAEGQMQAEADQVIKAARARSGGPAIINPMGHPGNGFMPR